MMFLVDILILSAIPDVYNLCSSGFKQAIQTHLCSSNNFAHKCFVVRHVWPPKMNKTNDKENHATCIFNLSPT